MKRTIAHTTLLVKDYDDAIDFYVNKLGFTLVQDLALAELSDSGTPKRWVLISPDGSAESQLLLAKADGEAQERCIGNQSGNRVFLFLHTDDFWRDHASFVSKGVRFVRGEPREEAYGTVAVFQDLYGNLWDLIEPRTI